MPTIARKPHTAAYLLLCCCAATALIMLSPAAHAQTAAIARCKGHGTVSFEGSGTISINGEGFLLVSDNASVTFTVAPDAADQGTSAQPECIATGTGYCIYAPADGTSMLAGPGGRAEVSGVGIKLSFAGSNIGLTAQGDGRLALKGYGIYVYDKTFGRWSADKTGAILVLKP